MTDVRSEYRVSGRRVAEAHRSGFERTTLKIPASVPLFDLDAEKPRKVDILIYRVGQGNPYAREPGTFHYERTYWAHRGIGPDQGWYVCTNKTMKKPCYVCEYRSRLAKDASASEDLVKELAPRERQLWNIIDLEATDKGVQIWDISYHLFGKQLNEELKNADEDDQFDYFASLVGGFSMKLGVREKSFNGRKFYEVSTIAFKPRRDYDPSILNKVHCLDEMLYIPTYEELRDLFMQSDDTGKSADSPDREPRGPVRMDDDGWDSPATRRTVAAPAGNGSGVTRGPAPVPQAATQPVVQATPQTRKLKCPACEGTGKSSRGNTCHPCGGSGQLDTGEVDAPTPAPVAPQAERSVPVDDGWGTPQTQPATSAQPARPAADNWDNW